MNKSIYREIINIHLQSKVYKILLLLLAFGCWIVLSYSPSLSYIDMLNFASGSRWLITFFIVPVFILIGYENFSIIENNYHLCGRLKNREQYFMFQIKSIFFITLILFIKTLFLLIIFTNLYNLGGIKIQPDNIYNVLNIISCIFNYIKLFIFIMLIQFLNIIFIKIMTKKNLIILLNFVILYSLFNPQSFEKIPLFKYILVSKFIGFSFKFSTFINSVVYSLLYFGVILCFLFFIAKFIILKKDVLVIK